MSLSSDSLRPSFNCHPAPWIIQDKVSSGLLITYGSHIVAGRAMRSRPIRGARPPMGHGLSLEKCGQAIVERPEELRLLYLVTGDIYTDGQQFFRLQSRDLNGQLVLRQIGDMGGLVPAWSSWREMETLFDADYLLLERLKERGQNLAELLERSDLELAKMALEMQNIFWHRYAGFDSLATNLSALPARAAGQAMIWGWVQAQLPVLPLEQVTISDVATGLWGAARDFYFSHLSEGLKMEDSITDLRDADLQRSLVIARLYHKTAIVRAIKTHLVAQDA